MTDESKDAPKAEPKVEYAKIDYNRVGMLLVIVSEAAKHNAIYSSIAGEAGLELAAINTEVKAFADKRNKAALAKAAADQAALEAKAKLDADKAAKDATEADAKVKAEYEASQKALAAKAPNPTSTSSPVITPATDSTTLVDRRPV